MQPSHKDLFNQALAAADHYRGDEAGYAHLGETLILLEAAMRTEYEIPKGRVPDELEETFNQIYGGMKLTLNGLLTRADRAQMRFLQQWVDDDKSAAANALLADIISIKTNFAVLPPKKDAAPVLGDDTGELKAAEFRPRRAEVLHFLTNANFAGQRVFMDQLLRYEGALLPGQMRKAAYDVIDIIPWGIQIAVCDQVGEAMFVMPKPASEFSIADWGHFDKDAVVEQHGGIQIKMTANWPEKLAAVIEAKLSGVDFAPAPKKDIAAAKKYAREGRIPLTETMRTELAAEIYRTNFGYKKIYATLKDELILNSALGLASWRQKRKNGNWNTTSCELSDYRNVINFLHALPSAFYLDENNRREKLITDMKRTGMGTRKIETALRAKHNINYSKVGGWVHKYPNGQWTTFACNETEYNTVMALLAQKPNAFYLDEKDSPDDKLTRREMLLAEVDRTGKKWTAIISGLGVNCPNNLTWRTIHNWVTKTPNGKWHNATCEEVHYRLVMKFFETLHTAMLKVYDRNSPATPLASGAEPL